MSDFGNEMTQFRDKRCHPHASNSVVIPIRLERRERIYGLLVRIGSSSQQHRAEVNLVSANP